MERVLVTGSHGLVGLHVVPLLAKSRQVHAMARAHEPHPDQNVVPIAMNLSEPLDLSKLPERIDSVVWLAQSPRFREFPEGADDLLQVNVAQLHAMVDYARKAGAKKFVYASTGSVYLPSDSPLTEDSPVGQPGSLGFYPATRLAAELLVGSYASLMDVTILRFFFIYGRGRKRDMLLPRLIDTVREGRAVTLQGEQGIRINPLNARDAAKAIEAALSLQGMNIVNVAGPEPLSIRDICDVAGTAVGVDPVYKVDETARVQDVTTDISRMTKLLGAPAITFREGVADLL